jgi:hypothetical protein
MAHHEDGPSSSCFIKQEPDGAEGIYASYGFMGEWGEYCRIFNKTPPPKTDQGLTLSPKIPSDDDILIPRWDGTPMSHDEAVAIDALWGGPLAPRTEPQRDDSKPQEDDSCTLSVSTLPSVGSKANNSPQQLVQSVETPRTPDPSPTPPVSALPSIGTKANKAQQQLVQSAETPPASIDRSRTPSVSTLPSIRTKSNKDSQQPVQSDCLASSSQTPARSETPPTPIDTSPAPARSETPPAPIGTSPAPARSETQEDRILKIGIDKLTTLGEATKQIIFEREHYHQLLTDMKGQLTVKEARIRQLEAELQAARHNNPNSTSTAANGTTSSPPLMPQPQLEHGASNLNQYWVCCLMLLDGSGVQCHGINPEWHKLFKAGDGGRWAQRIQCVRCGRKNKSNRKPITHLEAKMLAAVTPQGRINPYRNQPRQTPSQTPSQTPLLLSGSRMPKKVPQPVYQQPMAQPIPYNSLPVIFTATSNTVTQIVQNGTGTMAKPLDIDHRKFMGITTPSPAPTMPQSIPEINHTQAVQAPPNVPALPKTNLTLPKTGLTLPQTGLTIPQTISNIQLAPTKLTFPKLPQSTSNIGTKRPAPAPKSDPPAPKKARTSFNVPKATQETLRRELPKAQKAWMKPGCTTSTSGEDEDDMTPDDADFLAEFNAALEATVAE